MYASGYSTAPPLKFAAQHRRRFDFSTSSGRFGSTTRAQSELSTEPSPRGGAINRKTCARVPQEHRPEIFRPTEAGGQRRRVEWTRKSAPESHTRFGPRVVHSLSAPPNVVRRLHDASPSLELPLRNGLARVLTSGFFDNRAQREELMALDSEGVSRKELGRENNVRQSRAQNENR